MYGAVFATTRAAKSKCVTPLRKHAALDLVLMAVETILLQTQLQQGGPAKAAAHQRPVQQQSLHSSLSKPLGQRRKQVQLALVPRGHAWSLAAVPPHAQGADARIARP